MNWNLQAIRDILIPRSSQHPDRPIRPLPQRAQPSTSFFPRLRSFFNYLTTRTLPTPSPPLSQSGLYVSEEVWHNPVRIPTLEGSEYDLPLYNPHGVWESVRGLEATNTSVLQTIIGMSNPALFKQLLTIARNKITSTPQS